MSLEYVVSGVSFIRLANEETISNPETVSKINNMFEKMFNEEETGHTFSMLYNAFCEHSYGEKFQKYATHMEFNFPVVEGTGIVKLIPHASAEV